jgi:hypothetical protein
MQMEKRGTKTGSVAARAYELWQLRGCPEGSPEVDWYEAERELSAGSVPPQSTDANVEESILGTFPASDPPASHTPDRPPSNAADKWDAARRAGKRR